MADEPQVAASGGKQKLSKGPMVTVALVVGVALLEGAIFFVAIKWFGAGVQPMYGQGEHLIEEEEVAKIETQEIQLLRGFRVPNAKDGQLKVYDLDITVVVPADDPDRLARIKEVLDGRIGELSDRAARVVRGATPRSLNEDDLRTLRLQLKTEITDVVGDPDAIMRVLIPRCVPMYAG
jgi:hypothetical protein